MSLKYRVAGPAGSSGGQPLHKVWIDMIRNRTVYALLGAAFLATACGGASAEADHDEMDDMDAAAGGAGAAMAMGGPEDSCFLARGTLAEATARPSPLKAIHLSGDAGVLCWGAPAMKGRTIFGELENYGETWRMGANEATALHLTSAITLGGVALEPGSYSLYAVPGMDSWEIFVNSNAERWGIPIDDGVMSTNVGSFTVNPEATSAPVETLTYRSAGGVLTMEWENTRLSMPMGM